MLGCYEYEMKAGVKMKGESGRDEERVRPTRDGDE